MVVDTSALMAIVFDEPDGDALLQRIVDDPLRLVSDAPPVLPAGRVGAKGP